MRVTTDSKHYENMAAKIREKTGTDATYKPSEMPSGVDAVYKAGQSSMVDESKLIHTTVSGSYISLDDVSELPHAVECKVESINLLRNKSETATLNGLTFTVNNDKSITVTGTATEETVYAIGRQWLWTKGIYPGNFTISGTPSGYDGQLCIQVNWADVDSETELAKDTGDSASFEIPEPIIISTSIVVKSGTALTDVTFYPMLNRGTTALPYTPYVSPESVSVTRTGKNIVDILNGATQYKTVTIREKTESTIVLSCTGEYKGVCYILPKNLVGKYLTISGEWDAANGAKGGLRINWIKNNNAANTNGTQIWAKTSGVAVSGLVSSPTEEDAFLGLMVYGNLNGSIDGEGVVSYRNIQVEVGNVATEYEPYNGQTLTPAADGTVEGMTSVSPYMNIFSDTEGVNIEATYNKSWGMQTEYDRFWDAAQNNGTRTMYMGFFAGSSWDENSLKPKYIVKPTGNGGYQLFMYCNYGGKSKIDYRNIKEKIDLSELVNTSGLFQDAVMDYIDVDLTKCVQLSNGFSEGWGAGKKTTISLYITEKCTTFGGCFNSCTALTNLTFKEGSVIAATLNIQYSPLTKASITSVVNALSSTATGQTLTLKLSAVNTAFETSSGAADGSTSAEFAALVATKTNWTITMI